MRGEIICLKKIIYYYEDYSLAARARMDLIVSVCFDGEVFSIYSKKFTICSASSLININNSNSKKYIDNKSFF